MAQTNRFYDVGINNQQAKPSIDYIVNEAPVLAMALMEPTTNGWSDITTVMTSVDSMFQTDLDAGVQRVSSAEKIVETKVSKFSGMIEIGRDSAKLYPGGASDYFAEKSPKHYKKAGADIEGTFLAALRQFAITNENIFDATGSDDENYSIIAVTWEEDEITGIYNPESFGSAGFIEVEFPNGGTLQEIGQDDAKNPKFGYRMLLDTNFGIKLLNPKYVSAIVNIDKKRARAAVTTELIHDMLTAATRKSSTMIVCHPDLIPIFQDIMKGMLQVSNADNGINTEVYSYNGTPIVPSFNMPAKTEANVTVS